VGKLEGCHCRNSLKQRERQKEAKNGRHCT
jgi:hypothetical protein